MQNKLITTNYRHGVKPRANYRIPKMKCAVLIRPRRPVIVGRRREAPPLQDIYLKNLHTIPAKYLRSKVRVGHRWRRQYTILRQEAYCSLADIRAHYERLHPCCTRAELEAAYSKASLGIDGVQESKHGKRTLIFITVQINGEIFLWKVLNPLKKVAGAKPDAEEMLRYN